METSSTSKEEVSSSNVEFADQSNEPVDEVSSEEKSELEQHESDTKVSKFEESIDAEATSLEESIVNTWMNYEVKQGPVGLTIDHTTGNISFTPQRGQEGSHFVSIKAIDEWNDVIFQDFTLVVSALPNSPPIIDDVGSLTFTVGKLGTMSLSASDIDGDNLQWNLLEGPDGLVLQSDGSISWTPLSSQNEQIKVLFVGWLEDFKGVFELLNAARKLLQSGKNISKKNFNIPLISLIESLRFEYVICSTLLYLVGS